MNEVRRKQKRLYKTMRTLVIFGALFLIVYIGISPTVAELNHTLSVVLYYICNILVVAVLVVLFVYYSKYGKVESFLNNAENEITDAGYYFTSRQEKSIDDYCSVMYDDLQKCGFYMDKNLEINDFDFFARAMKRKEFFYIADILNVDRNDVLAYLDTVIFDITANNIKRSGDGVLCFVTDKADDSAVSLSKMITPLGKKEKLKIAIAIAETSTGRVYFLGNAKTKCQQLIANFVMNCDVPIKEEYIAKEKLSFQSEIEEKMKKFNLKDYRNGDFYIH